jgi:hypothetical protein
MTPNPRLQQTPLLALLSREPLFIDYQQVASNL